MSQSKYPSTAEGSNWTVAVFMSPRKNWTETLTKLYSELDRQGLSLIPHYTLRFFDKSIDSLIVSFRVLRQKEHEAAIKSLLENFLKDYPEHEIDPGVSSPLYPYHEWIPHGNQNPHWTRENSLTLSKLSRLVLEILNSNTTVGQRYEWLHLFAHMSAIFQIREEYWTPETYPSIAMTTHSP